MTWVVDVLCGPLGLVLFPLGCVVVMVVFVCVVALTLEGVARLVDFLGVRRPIHVAGQALLVLGIVFLLVMCGYTARRDFCRWQHHHAYIQGAC